MTLSSPMLKKFLLLLCSITFAMATEHTKTADSPNLLKSLRPDNKVLHDNLFPSRWDFQAPSHEFIKGLISEDKIIEKKHFVTLSNTTDEFYRTPINLCGLKGALLIDKHSALNKFMEAGKSVITGEIDYSKEVSVLPQVQLVYMLHKVHCPIYLVLLLPEDYENYSITPEMPDTPEKLLKIYKKYQTPPTITGHLKNSSLAKQPLFQKALEAVHRFVREEKISKEQIEILPDELKERFKGFSTE